MREIKFRCFEENKGMWGMNSNSAMNLAMFWAYVADIKGNPNVMQYTELKDKNGKEIYEGDILENNTHRKQLIEVYWKGCVKDGENVNGKEWINWGGWYFRKLSNEKEMTYSVDNDQIEIIGNIYENPELLNPHTT